MFGQMTAGSWIYIGTQGILQGTYQTFAAAGEQHFGTADLSGRTILTAGLGGMGGAQPLAATLAGGVILCVEVDPTRIERRHETGYLDRSTDSLDEALGLVRDGARSARGLRPGGALGRGRRRAPLERSRRVPPPCPRVDRPARRGPARVRPSRQLCFRLWQQPSR